MIMLTDFGKGEIRGWKGERLYVARNPGESEEVLLYCLGISCCSWIVSTCPREGGTKTSRSHSGLSFRSSPQNLSVWAATDSAAHSRSQVRRDPLATCVQHLQRCDVAIPHFHICRLYLHLPSATSRLIIRGFLYKSLSLGEFDCQPPLTTFPKISSPQRSLVLQPTDMDEHLTIGTNRAQSARVVL
jgi:hypothetical protein